MDVLTLAFSADPIERWLYPDPHEYLKNFRIFLKAFTAKTFEVGTAYHVDSYAGTALWLPPNSHPDDESIIAALEETVDKQTLTDSLEILEQMDRYHPPEPH